MASSRKSVHDKASQLRVIESRSIVSAVSGSAINSIALNPTNVNIMVLIRQERSLSTLVNNYTRGMQVSMAALTDLEAILSPDDKYDYCSYIT